MTIRLSLKTRIVLAVLGIFVLGFGALVIHSSLTLRRDMQRVLGEQQYSTVSVVAEHINRDLENRVKTLIEIADSASLIYAGGAPAVQELLEQRHDLQVLFNGGTFAVGVDGVALAAVPRSSGRVGIDYSDREYLVFAMRNGLPNISDPLIGRASGIPVVVVAVPVRDAGKQVVGVLAGVVNLGQSNFLDQATQGQYGRTGGFQLLVPRQRLIATATDKRRVMETLAPEGRFPLIDQILDGFEGSGILVDPAAEEVLMSSKVIRQTGWSVVATLPTDEAFAPVRDALRRMLLTAGLVVLVAVLMIFVLLRRQLAPLGVAAVAIARMSRDPATLKPLPVKDPDEIGELIGGFNRLVESLKQQEHLIRDVLDTATVGIFLVDMQGRIVQANRSLSELFGYPTENLIGREYVTLIHPAQREEVHQIMRSLLASTTDSVSVDRLYSRADGSEFWVHLTGKRLYDAHGTVRGLVGVVADIGERKRAEDSLRLAASVFTHAREGITITAADGSIIDVNEAFTRITGYTREEVIGHNPRVLKSEHHDPEFYAGMWRDLLNKGEWSGEIWNRRKSGELYPEVLTISAVKDAQGSTEHYVALFSDISPQKAHEQQLEQMAHYDLLTTLPNRVLLADRLHQAMAQAQRRRQRLAVVYLDLDGFKAINDKYGHKTGDQLLIALSGRMKHILREGDTLARLGGDEFVAVLLDLEDVSSSQPMLNRLLSAAAQPVVVGDHLLQVSASLGITFYPQHEEVDADQLLRQADQAMYQAKLAGKNRFHFFDTEQAKQVRGQHETLDRMRMAMVANEFVLYFQPKVNMRTGTVIGAEALIRWQHPERGLLPPGLFLPDIEDTPLAVDLGEWVIGAALRSVERWRDQFGLDLPVSVNLGARQLQQRDFALRLREILASHPSVRPGDLELEVLETSALEDLERVSTVIRKCQEMGVKFALDDFGTGYSSLTYLKRLSVDQLKIDQSFVRDMLDDSDDLAILEGVIGLATAFRRKVIAEGVETINHGTLLLQLGCELAQGYGIARPMPADDLPGWIRSWRPDPAWLDCQTVRREQLPILFACTEHRAWVSGVSAYIRGEREAPPTLDTHECDFGQWLDSEGREQFAAALGFRVIERRHHEIHALASDLCALHRGDCSGEARLRLAELKAAQDALIEELLKLLELPVS